MGLESEPIAKMADMGGMSAQGGFLVAISNVVHPTLLHSNHTTALHILYVHVL